MNEEFQPSQSHEGHPQPGPERHHHQQTPAEYYGMTQQHERQPHNIHEIRQNIQHQHEVLETDRSHAQAEHHTAHHQHQQAHQGPVSQQVKALVYDRTLLKVRRHLSPVGRVTSKVIHQKTVEAVSEAASKTVARPSGLLGGGIAAFLGTLAYYLLVKHYNYSYRFSVFLALLIGGFIAGWLAEKLFWRSKPSR